MVLIRARGGQGQVAETRLRLTVRPRAPEVPPPTVSLLRVPDELRVGREARFAFQADGCLTAVAKIETPGGETLTWQFACPAGRASFAWTPAEAGRHLLTATASGGGTTAQVATTMTVEEP